ncbi:MAG: 3-deoxy-D-manno-octulosonic acid transferase [Candidatus Omnitrophota bacterium]
MTRRIRAPDSFIVMRKGVYMFIVYDLIFLLVGIFFLPVYFFRRKFHSGFLARLGFLPKESRFDRPIWIHAVSVGEVNAISALLQELRKANPGKQIVISTVTATGNRMAQAIAQGKDFVTYLPLDLGFAVKSAIDRINPSLFIIVETEIWPNLLTYLHRKRIPVITVNGRISDRSFKGYLSLKFLLKPILAKVALFCMQSELDAKRLKRLGVSQEKIQVTGNMKFDAKIELEKKEKKDTQAELGLGPKDKLLVAGSTHRGEEEIVLAAYRQLLREFPHLKLLIAPRHIERSQDIEKIVSRFGFHGIFVSSRPRECHSCAVTPVFILDKLGELISFYSIADIVFVGGSLIKKGGHNILEPAFLSKPILFGPHMFNFRDIEDLFLADQAALMVQDEEELRAHVARLLNEPFLATELSQRGQRIIAGNRGATLKNLQFIKKLLS